MDDVSTKQEKKINNPAGNGGFGDHPEHRNDGAWKKTETFRYWFDLFKEMTVAQLKRWQEETPEDTRTVVANLAYARIINSLESLKEFKEVADRTEGKSLQTIKHSGEMNINVKKLETIIDELLNDEPSAEPT